VCAQRAGRRCGARPTADASARPPPAACRASPSRRQVTQSTLMGWFGPRGLASVVFTLMAVERFTEVSRPADTLVATATWTILLSVVAHGLSAMPLSAWYARRLRSRRSSWPTCPSHASVAASWQARRESKDRRGNVAVAGMRVTCGPLLISWHYSRRWTGKPAFGNR
jgi:hypothetical protein